MKRYRARCGSSTCLAPFVKDPSPECRQTYGLDNAGSAPLAWYVASAYDVTVHPSQILHVRAAAPKKTLSGRLPAAVIDVAKTRAWRRGEPFREAVPKLLKLYVAGLDPDDIVLIPRVDPMAPRKQREAPNASSMTGL